MRLVDTHAHLAMLEHDAVDLILARAQTEGVEKMITVSVDEASWEKNRSLAEAHDSLFYSIGLHPHESEKWPACRERAKGYFQGGLAPHKCVAIGELGLDFYYDKASRQAQLLALEEQIHLANEVGLPIIIHCRDAFTELYQTIRRCGLNARGGVMHCFTGTTENALEAIDLGLKISFSGILTFRNAEGLRETAKALPLSEIFLETDCPFLAPIPYRGKPNEPSFLPWTARVLAQAKDMEVDVVAQATSDNAVAFFKLT